MGSEPGSVSRANRPLGCLAPTNGDSNRGAIQHSAAQRLDLGKRISPPSVAAHDPDFSPADGEAIGELLAPAPRRHADLRDTALQSRNCGELEFRLSG